MRRWNAPFCLLLCLAPAARLAAQPSDGITLTLVPGPDPLEVTLEWTGGQPDFEVFRSADPAMIFDSGSRLGETSSRIWVDLPGPDGVVYYAVAPKDPPDATIVPGAPDRVLLSGTVAAPDGPFEGEVLIEGPLITCVAPSCSGQPGAAGATVVTTNGIILPGLIDAHNHGLFNIFDESDWSPQRLYTNHNQWTAETRYQEMVDAKQYLGGEGTSPVDDRCEMDKYAEIKALAAGTTSFLLAPGTSRSCFASLARTIDTPQNDLGADRIQTSISVPSSTSAQSVCNNFASGTTNAYVVHIAEGTDQTALNEFNALAGRAGGCLLSPLTTIVHGTALGAAEFATMAAHGMRLVWSPKSNMFLYGGTTRVDLAIAAGVSTIALAPDWALGGGVNLLDELRSADAVDAAQFGDILTPERLFRMVTIDAARALGVDALLGSLEPGKRADIAVIGGDRADPYAALLAATPRDVRLVMVDGRALFGDSALIAAGPATPGCETIPLCGRGKFLCAAEEATTDKLGQTYGEILQVLESALADYDAGVLGGTAPGFSPIAPLAACP
jgi:cytosine/adenosine deaminase-related metal-dependent hydrolase